MQPGSLVETVGDFSETQAEWPMIKYPAKGDILTVAAVNPHPNEECRQLGIVLLTFDELPHTPGLCDKTMEGEDNFVELQPPGTVSIENLMEEEVYA